MLRRLESYHVFSRTYSKCTTPNLLATCLARNRSSDSRSTVFHRRGRGSFCVVRTFLERRIVELRGKIFSGEKCLKISRLLLCRLTVFSVSRLPGNRRETSARHSFTLVLAVALLLYYKECSRYRCPLPYVFFFFFSLSFNNAPLRRTCTVYNH